MHRLKKKNVSFNSKCPTFDTIYNVEYEGFRQTMTGQSTIIVQVISICPLTNYFCNVTLLLYIQREQFLEGFYLVYIVNTNDDKCVNSRALAPMRTNRTKEVKFTIQETVCLLALANWIEN